MMRTRGFGETMALDSMTGSEDADLALLSHCDPTEAAVPVMAAGGDCSSREALDSGGGILSVVKWVSP